jgi:hypothetical protein
MSLLTEMQADSPRGLWKLDGPTGTPATDADLSGNSNTLTENGNGRVAFVASIIPTVTENASDIDGANNSGWYASDHATLDLGNIWSLETWAQFDSFGADNILIAKNLSYEMAVDSSGYLYLGRPTYGILAFSTITMSTGNVYHCVATKNGATSKLYINGVDVTGTVTDGTAIDSSSSLFIGCSWAQGAMMNGRIQMAAVYPTALSAARVLAHYNAGILTLDTCLPDADVTTTGWTTAPLFSKINDASDATVIQATAV